MRAKTEDLLKNYCYKSKIKYNLLHNCISETIYSTPNQIVDCSRQRWLTEWAKHENMYATLWQEMELECAQLKNHVFTHTHKRTLRTALNHHAGIFYNC